MAGKLGFKHRHVMKTLIFFNTLRGRDSTGVSVYNQNRNDVETKKSTVPGYEFVQFGWIDRLLADTVGCWIGHGRAQTVGAIVKANAHPFEVRDNKDLITLFGAHNGTLKNKWELERDHLDKANFGTDSEAFINLIAKVGPKNAVAAATGAWALTWWASENRSVNLLRNKERPLCFSYSEDKTALIWASEPWMIEIACAREDLSLIKVKGNEEIFRTDEDTLYSWVIPTFKGNDQAFSTPRKKSGLFGKPEKTYPPQYNHQQRYDERGPYGYGLDDDFALQAARKEEKTKPNVYEVSGFEGEPVSRLKLQEMKKEGCGWCGDTITGDAFAFLSEDDLCCDRCRRGEHIKVDVEKGIVVERILSLAK